MLRLHVFTGVNIPGQKRGRTCSRKRFNQSAMPRGHGLRNGPNKKGRAPEEVILLPNTFSRVRASTIGPFEPVSAFEDDGPPSAEAYCHPTSISFHISAWALPANPELLLPGRGGLVVGKRPVFRARRFSGGAFIFGTKGSHFFADGRSRRTPDRYYGGGKGRGIGGPRKAGDLLNRYCRSMTSRRRDLAGKPHIIRGDHGAVITLSICINSPRGWW